MNENGGCQHFSGLCIKHVLTVAGWVHVLGVDDISEKFEEGKY